jgi:hypothetical protein
MNIPLHRLYQYIESQAQQIWQNHVLIYRFYPHGSKDFHDLSFLTDHYTLDDLVLCPYIYCNDQEPLDWARYQSTTNQSLGIQSFSETTGLDKQNFRDYPIDIWDWALLLHSEQGGYNLAQYQSNGFLPVYYWSHAIIARDWFRYAKHVQQQKRVEKFFLIYNRAWSGTREYRLKFADLLIEFGLDQHCQTWVNVVDPECNIHYQQYNFCNPQWKPRHQLENYFDSTLADSKDSADFNLADYETTEIEVVLETLFDDDRVHLTEKILRPISLSQPFILVGATGSLKYLRDYGFETFDSVWSEEYDLIQDPVQRLQSIATLMETIINWSPEVRARRMLQAQAIAKRNHERFFSNEFDQQILCELNTNLTSAFDYLRHHNTSSRWLKWHQIMNELSSEQLQSLNQSQIDHGDRNQFLNRFTTEHWKKFLTQAKRYQTRQIETERIPFKVN